MDEGLLKLTNYRDHPTQPEYKVFFFHDHQRADSFEGRLEEAGVFYQRENPSGNERHVLFAVKRSDFTKVDHLNNLTTAQHRQKFIPHKPSRMIVLLITLVILGLAIVGWVKSTV